MKLYFLKIGGDSAASAGAASSSSRSRLTKITYLFLPPCTQVLLVPVSTSPRALCEKFVFPRLEYSPPSSCYSFYFTFFFFYFLSIPYTRTFGTLRLLACISAKHYISARCYFVIKARRTEIFEESFSFYHFIFNI